MPSIAPGVLDNMTPRLGNSALGGLTPELRETLAGPVTNAQVTDGPSCAGTATVRLTGGPFQMGADRQVTSGGPNRWRAGKTFVEIQVSDSRTSSFFNSLIYSVNVRSESEIEVELFGCIVVQRPLKIRVIYPDGRKSGWKDIVHQ